MSNYLDRVPFSGIIRIRDMMYGVENPFRLDQGDVSFPAPDSVKAGMLRAIAEDQTHYAQTTGLPRLRDLLAEKLRRKNGLPVGSTDEILVTNGGIHAVYVICQALLEPGDEVIIPDPEWPPCAGNILAARGVPVGCPLHQESGWGYDLDELRSKITDRTRAIYLNSPHNPTGGVLSRGSLEAISAIAGERNLWLISDEAYEDIVFGGAEHVSPGSFPDAYQRTIGIYTFSKSYAMTGLRLGYTAVKDPALRERARKALFYTTTNVSTVVQHGGIGGLEGPQDCIDRFREELRRRRDLFYAAIAEMGPEIFSGARPHGAFYAFLKIGPALARMAREQTSRDRGQGYSASWAVAEHLISRARIGCVPGVDFGPTGENYVRFCFAREPSELAGALESMRSLFGVSA